MNIGIYQSAAALSALEKWQDAAAQNVTSASMPGYRERMVGFTAVSGGSWTPEGGTDTDSSVSALFPTASTSISYQSGDTERTGRDLDVAIQGDGFFEIQQPDGTKAYTRNGQFSETPTHTLVSSAGAPVLNNNGAPITLLPSGGSITINPDGSIVQGQTMLGKLGVVQFADNKQLVPAGSGLFVPTGGAEATPVAKPELLQGYREESNVSPMHEMVDIVTISRSYEANQKVITSADERGQKSVDMLG